MRKYVIKQFIQEIPCKLPSVIHDNFHSFKQIKGREGFETLESMINQKLYLIWVVLFHDTRSNVTLCLTSYVYFSEHARKIQIICEEFTWHCTISTWNVNCINLFSSGFVERMFVLFYQLFALREKNQTRFELSHEVFDMM